LRSSGRVVGIASLITNFKNKAGKGSNQDESVVIKVKWKSSPAVVSYIKKEDLEDR